MSHFDTTLVFEAEERGLFAAADDWSVVITSIKCSRFWLRAETGRACLITDITQGDHELGDVALALRLCLKIAGQSARHGFALTERAASIELTRELAAEVARQERMFLKDVGLESSIRRVIFD